MDGLPIKTGSCVYYTNYLEPSTVYTNDKEEIMDISTESSVAWINCPVDDVKNEAEETAIAFGFSPILVQRLLSSRYAAFQDNDVEMGLQLPAIYVKGNDVETHPVLILIRDGVLLSIQDRHVTRFASFIRYAESYIRRMPSDFTRLDQMMALLLRLIEENNRRNFNGIRSLNDEVDKVNKKVTDGRTDFKYLISSTRGLKTVVLKYLGALWENYHVMKSLERGDAMLMSSRPEHLDKIGMIVIEHSTYIRLAENLTSASSAGAIMHENYMVQLLKMNNLLQYTSAWLGILGTIFLVPNTIATAASNTTYPEFPGGWPVYSAILVIATLISTWATYRAIRKIWDVTMADVKLKARLTQSLLKSSRKGPRRMNR